jgi:hypothetical protein
MIISHESRPLLKSRPDLRNSVQKPSPELFLWTVSQIKPNYFGFLDTSRRQWILPQPARVQMEVYQWIRPRMNCGSNQEPLSFSLGDKGVRIDGWLRRDDEPPMESSERWIHWSDCRWQFGDTMKNDHLNIQKNWMKKVMGEITASRLFKSTEILNQKSYSFQESQC